MCENCVAAWGTHLFFSVFIGKLQTEYLDSIFTVLVVKVARKAFFPFSTELHCMSLIDLDCDNNPGGGGGGTSLNKPYRFVPHQNLCFLCRYGLKTSKDFAHFGLESGMAFEGTTGVYERICCFKSK